MVDEAHHPRVDVVILSWNRWQHTLAAVESTLRQTGIDLRIYIVDQNSDAEDFSALSRSLIDREKVDLVRLDQNLGVPGGRNFGASLGCGKFIFFLDNDAEFDGDEVCARAAWFFERDSTLGALAFHIVNATTGLTDLTSWNHAQDVRTHAALTFQSTRFSGGGCAIRRDVYVACGGFDEALIFMEEEKDLGYRIINQGKQILHRPDLVVRHKISPEKRMDWSNGRTYFLCRNIVFCELKYASPWREQFARIRDALWIGRRMGHTLQGLRGVIAGLGLGLRRRLWQQDRMTPLSAATRDYIRCHETRHYGSAPEVRRPEA